MLPLLSEVLWVSADELLGIMHPCKNPESDGQSWVKTNELTDCQTSREAEEDRKTQESSDPVLNQRKVVMLSALSQEPNVKRALQFGADAFVVKPFQATCLIERIG